MVEYIGFEGTPAFSVIIWQRNGEGVSKTVCYTKQEEIEAISRFYAPGDLYNTYDIAVIHREKGTFEITAKEAI